MFLLPLMTLAGPSKSCVAQQTQSASSATQPQTQNAELEFLKLASGQVGQYIQAFVDLTADESREMQTFSGGGQVLSKRTEKSALVVYRLHTDPHAVVEYREVVSVDGREIKGHENRAMKMWQEVTKAHSPEAEVRLIRDNSQHYDIGPEETGFTLFEGLPLRAECGGDFRFLEKARGELDGRQVRIFQYDQLHACNVVAYHFRLHPRYRDAEISQFGEVSLDETTAQVVREERNVYVGPKLRVAHIVLDYGKSEFGILVPTIITVETFAIDVGPHGETLGNPLTSRTILSYGPFSRFSVSVSEKSLPAQ